MQKNFPLNQGVPKPRDDTFAKMAKFPAAAAAALNAKKGEAPRLKDVASAADTALAGRVISIKAHFPPAAARFSN